MSLDLFDAIEQGDLGQVWTAVKAARSLQIEDRESGLTPLALAAELGHTEVVRILLEQDIDPNWGGSVTPLEAAVLEGNPDIVGLLIEAGANVDLPVDEGFTPLMSAATIGNLRIVRILLDAGARPDLTNDEGDTAVDLAEDAGHDDIAELLDGWVPKPKKVPLKPAPPADPSTLLEAVLAEKRARDAAAANVANTAANAAPSGDPRSAPTFFGVVGGPEPVPISGAVGLTELRKLPEMAQMREMREMREPRVPSTRPAEPAASAPAPPASQWPEPAPAPEASRTPAVPATPRASDPRAERQRRWPSLAQPPRAEASPRAGDRVDDSGDRPDPTGLTGVDRYLGYLAIGHTDRALRMIERGQIGVDERDSEGRTALGLAIEHGALEVVDALLAGGADVDLAEDTDDAETPLVKAMQGESAHRVELVQRLLEAGAGLERTYGRKGMTPLMAAALSDVYGETQPLDFAPVTKLLIARGADLEATDLHGNTVWRNIKRSAMAALTSSPYRRRLHQMLRVLETSGAQQLASHEV